MRTMVVVGLLLGAGSAYAHHSQAAQYDTSKEVRIEGTLVQFQFRNPHTFVHVEAPDDKGVMQRWSDEDFRSNSFVGRFEVSKDGGKTWRLVGLNHMQRQGAH